MTTASRFRIYAATAIAVALMATTATAAVDMFLKLDGVDGESVDKKHPGTIEVESFSWGMEKAASSGGGGGGAGLPATFSDFTIHKLLDKSSPVLMLACATGQHIKSAQLYVRKAGGTQTDFYVVTLSDILVTSFPRVVALETARPNP